MPKVPDISDAEWKVIQVLWKKSPQTSAEIVEAVQKVEDWHPNTVKTLLSRLHTKGAIGIRKDNRRHMYFAKTTESDAVRYESNSFLNRLFDGNVKQLLVHFVEKQSVSAKDLEELRAILKTKAK